MYREDTIAAPATATSMASVNIIRISGEESLNIINKIFMPKIKGKKLEDNKRKLVYGHIVDTKEDNKVVDEVLVSFMPKPFTFTCEDIVEINLHGGKKAVEEVMKLVLKNGARIAEKGEFTKRAFLNGRIDLSKAEAVIDVINAKSSKAFYNAERQLQGRLTNKLDEIEDKIKSSIAKITVSIDFPEEDVPDVTNSEILEDLNSAIDDLKKLEKSYKNGKIIKDGINISIIGRPNVGKSSLLNELLEENRAIVTDVAGTTRDIIKENLYINGVSVNIIDTAGIRETKDTVEKIGVEKSISSIDEADVILLLIDSSNELKKEDLALLEKLKDREYIVLLSKSDLNQKVNLNEFPNFIKRENIMNISTVKNQGIESLKEKIYSIALSYEDDTVDNIMITNIRHLDKIKKAIKSLEDAKNALNLGISLDIIETDFKDAIYFLGEITGKSVSEDLLDTIFSKFCIGK